jgi:hypothetical protein
VIRESRFLLRHRKTVGCAFGRNKKMAINV